MSMILLFHIVIALASLVLTAIAVVAPKRALLYVSYGMIVLTVASGTYIAIASPAHMVQACISGLIYTVVVVSGVVTTHRKLVVDR